MQFQSSKLGININLRAAINDFKLDKKQTVKELLSLPFDHVRIPIPMDEVNPTQNTWDFSTRDWIIEEAIKKRKRIHLQFGVKTIGWPEIHAPRWLLDKYPYLLQANSTIDQDEEVRYAIILYIEQCAKRYMGMSQLVSIQLENEPFSKNLWVSRSRSISPLFNQEEIANIKRYNKHKVPVIQNAPFDTLVKIPYVVKYHDIVGLNIYPQVYYNWMIDKTFWFLMRRLVNFTNFMKKPIYITEYQTAAWLNSDLKPSYPFYLSRFEQGFVELKKLKPEIIFLWDVEQVLWLAKQGINKYWNKIINACS